MQAVVAAIAAFILTQVQLGSAQVSNVTRCVQGAEWTINSLGQTPCYVAAWLESICTGSSVNITSIPPGNHYLAPPAGLADVCWCNTVTYSAISACAVCQDRPYLAYANWVANCPALIQTGLYPARIPSNVTVPSWAYLDISQTNFNFSITEARNAAAAATTTSTATTTPLPPSVAPSSTSTRQHITISNSEGLSQTSPVAAATGSTGSSSDSRSGLSGGAIAGVVIGVLIGVLLLLLFVIWRFVRNRRRHQPRPTLLNDSGPVSLPHAHERSASDPASIITPYTYGNSTPTRNPTSPGASTFYTTSHSQGRSSLDGTGRPVTLLSTQAGSIQQNLGYTGAAEI